MRGGVKEFSSVEECQVFLQKNTVEKATKNLAFIDLRIPHYGNVATENGRKIAAEILQHYPFFEIVFISATTNVFEILRIFSEIRPLGFLGKTELSIPLLKNSILVFLNGGSVFTKAVIKQIEYHIHWSGQLETTDFTIIEEILKTTKIPEIAQKVHLSVSGVEYRKRKIAELLRLPSAQNDEFQKFYHAKMGS